ncbi:MAG TPA: hypothetical protein VHX59_00710 [Mycobacteriales bacterium]|jgi:hypothetical protein|nr:hypothetical protein [Mycobacteriales bacterium]
MGFIVRNGRIVSIDVLADPARLDKLDLPAQSVRIRPECAPQRPADEPSITVR